MMLCRVAACAALLLLCAVCAGNGISLSSEAAAGFALHADDPSGPTPNSAADRHAALQRDGGMPAVEREAEPFGLDTELTTDGETPAKWSGVETQIRADEEVLNRCREDAPDCPEAARRFLAIVDDGRARNGRARVGVINREINLAIVPTSDLAQWGVADRWSGPLETFTTRRGDCEDYAIAKYVALRAAGVAPQDLRLVVVRNDDAGENHAVAAVRLDGDWIILDNRWLALVRDRDMWRATPLFVIDDRGVRQFVDTPLTVKLRGSAPASF